MIENPQTGKPPAAVHVHWTQYVLYSFALIGGVSLLAILVSLVLKQTAPSWADRGNEIGVGVLIFAVICVVALSGLCILFSAFSWLMGVPSIFRRCQFRITDLVLIVALLGNGAGLSFRLFGEEYPVLAVLMTVVLSTWVFLATAWMLWLAKRLQEHGGGRRAYFLLIGWSFPLALVAIIGGPFGMVVLLWDLFETDGTDELLKMYLGGLGVTMLAIGVGFWMIRRAVWLYQDAVQAGDPLAKKDPISEN